MHKLYLTKPECEIINGAQDIIDTIGGFPSMEDGQLIEILIKKRADFSAGDISLLFDISGWKHIAPYYQEAGNVKTLEQNLIRLNFENVTSVRLLDLFSAHGEIKFSNTADPQQMYQDDMVSNTPIFERPYCCFYISSRNVIIEFDEENCTISAHFEKDM